MGTWVRALPVLVLFAALVQAPRFEEVLSAQDDSVVGIGTAREPWYRFVARYEYSVSTVSIYGYLTSVAGLSDDQLFVPGGGRSAARARLTFRAELEPTDTAETEPVSVLTSQGQLTFFVSDGNASFDDPSSFATGTAVAIAEIVLTDVVDRESGDEVVLGGEATLIYTTSEPFTLGSGEVRLGETDHELIWTYSGIGVDSSDEPSLVVDIAGMASGHDTASSPVAGTPAATPATDGCFGFSEWLSETISRGNQTAQLRAMAPENLSVAAGDAAALQANAEQLTTISQDQRAARVPAIAQAANRLLVTTFSTYARGMTLAATAVADNDEMSLDQALTILATGDDLADRASAELTDLSTICTSTG